MEQQWTGLDGYEAFLQQELPSLARQEIERIVDEASEANEVIAYLRQQLPGIVHDIQFRVLHIYRQRLSLPNNNGATQPVAQLSGPAILPPVASTAPFGNFADANDTTAPLGRHYSSDPLDLFASFPLDTIDLESAFVDMPSALLEDASWTLVPDQRNSFQAGFFRHEGQFLHQVCFATMGVVSKGANSCLAPL